MGFTRQERMEIEREAQREEDYLSQKGDLKSAYCLRCYEPIDEGEFCGDCEKLFDEVKII